jgi:2'-5' RNA ligase
MSGLAPRPGDCVLVSLLQPLAPAERFRHWPLHFTVMPWFRTPLSDQDIHAEFGNIIHSFPRFTLTMGQEAYFGHDGKVPVRVAQSPNQLEKLHTELFAMMQQHPKFHILDMQHCGKNFRAHVTLHTDEPLREGDIVACNELQLVRLSHIHPGGSTKEIVSEVRLHDQSAS